MIDWFKNLLSSGTTESSKRFCMVLSYIVCLIYAGFCIFLHIPLDNNILTLLLGCLSGSTAGYVFSNKNEQVKKDPE